MPREAPRGALSPWRMDWEACKADLAAYEQLLVANAELSERNDILPFFRAHASTAMMLQADHHRLSLYEQ